MPITADVREADVFKRHQANQAGPVVGCRERVNVTQLERLFGRDVVAANQAALKVSPLQVVDELGAVVAREDFHRTQRQETELLRPIARQNPGSSNEPIAVVFRPRGRDGLVALR